MREAAAANGFVGVTRPLPQLLTWLTELTPLTELTNMKKTIWKSKTFWLQVATLASALVPQVQAFLVANPVEFVAVLAAANTIMRFATQGKIEILGDSAP